jgi:hydroxyethylthiazole kinase-like uncharacterized protein yjeF
MIPIDGQPILSAAAMRAAEERTIAAGSSVPELMARAGAEVARAVQRLAGTHEVLVLCGPGNNGGDGYVAAARLAEAGVKVRVAASAEPRGPAAADARTGWTGAVAPLPEAQPAPVLVDALFGTGLSRGLDDDTAAHLTRLAQRAQLVIAVDLPSGVATDGGAILSDHPGAQVTLALGALKPAHVLHPAAALCGTVRLLDIGISSDEQDAVIQPLGVPAPVADDHKFSRGMVAVVAGRMPGAAALAATAAARIAGYTLLLGSTTDRLPHAIVRRRWSVDALADERIGTIVIGPGLGRDEDAAAKLHAALASDRALVIDGDALHLLDPARLHGRAAPVILTPHAGEFTKLFGQAQGSKIDRARAAAQACGAIVAFKGADTVVAHPDGRTRTAARSVPWLATAGSGDVLAGIAGALLARGHVPFSAATEAVHLHIEAARRAGPAFIADELAAALPRALAQPL